MVKSKAVLILLAWGAWGASFTNTQSGDWNDPTTWGFSAGSCVAHSTCPAMTDSGSAGDTVLLASGFTVTCSTSCSVGNSPASDSGTIALGAVSYSSTTAVLIIGAGASFTYAGPVRQSNSTWTVGAGATVTYDSSWASSPTTAAYTWSTNHSGSSNGGRLDRNGTSGSHIIWTVGNSAANAACNSNACRAGRWGASSADNYADSGTGNCSYTDFSYLGDTRTGVFGNYGYFTSVAFASSSYDHCTWDQSQTVNFSEGGTNGTGSLTITGASITNTTSDNSSYGTLHFATKPSLGVRTFGNSYIEGGIFFDQVTGGVVATNLAFANLLFRPAATGYFGIAAGHGAVAAQINADQVLVYNDTTNDRSSGGPAGSQTHWYIARYDNSTDGNQHTFYPATGIGATYTGLVAEANTPGTEPDFINPAGTGTKTGGVPAPFVIQNSLLLCRGDGKPPSSFINDQQGIDGNEAMTYTNNTYCTAYSSAPPGNPVTDVHVIGIGWECGNCGTTSSTSLTVGTGAQSLTVGSNITLPVGNAIQIVSSINSANAMFGTVTSYSGTSLVVNITSVTGSGTFASWNVLGSDVVAGAISAVVNNLAYRLDSVGVVEIMCSDQQAPQPGTATLVSNNAAYNATNGVTNYCSTSTVGGRITTGPQNDLVFQRSPAFLSTTRMLISFDTDYLGNPLSSTTWTSGNVYNAGDLVQDSQGSVYGGKAFNWRAKATCTASSANRPYSGTSAFVACWEPAAMALIKASVRSSGNNTYTGALGGTGLSLIGALNEWVRQGYTPTGADATALATAGVGGIYPSWIGAIQATTPSSSSVLSGSINLSGGVVVH